jgi:hypothetical protein
VKRFLFALSYALVHVGPIYGLFGYVLLTQYLPDWLIVLPIFAVFVPAGAYLTTLRCPACGQKIYTTAHMRAAPGGYFRIPLYVFRECPECGHDLSGVDSGRR